jgi:hypothetical protein
MGRVGLIKRLPVMTTYLMRLECHFSIGISHIRIIATLSQYFDREMILADECLIRGDESGAAVYSHIANVIHAAINELEDLEE